MTLRVLVCGGRRYAERERLFAALDRFRAKFGISILIQGDCPTGADKHAKSWAIARAVPYLSVPADWDRLGDAAGPERNGRMLQLGAPERVLAFPGGAGTADCVRQARAAGIEVIEIPARKKEVP